MTKGTIIRTVALIIALGNQLFVMFGFEPLPVDEDQAANIINLGYMLFSAVITVITSLWAWWKNNSITNEAQQADTYLKGLKRLKESE